VSQVREPADDLEALRLELEALRRGLQATRERLKSVEGEVQTLKAAAKVHAPNGIGGTVTTGSSGLTTATLTPITGTSTTYSYVPDSLKIAVLAADRTETLAITTLNDPVVQAQSALNELRQHPDSKPAMARLESALVQLKKQTRETKVLAKPE
jgi:hypothetical protein